MLPFQRLKRAWSLCHYRVRSTGVVDMGYEGMNSEYYIGMKVPYYSVQTVFDAQKAQDWAGQRRATVAQFW